MRTERFFVFAKAQVSAFTGGVCDYSLMILLTELAHVHYPFSIVVAGLSGALVNFYINRKWTFKSSQSYHSTLSAQALKFMFVVAGSVFLKASGTYLLTSNLKIDYKISRLITDSGVSYGFNYVLIKYWVFRK